MKRNEVKTLLLEGKKIGEIFDLIPGQDCMIYKGKWPDDPEASDEIIYIPDIDLNDLEDDDVPVSEKLGFLYTAKDFLNQTGGNVPAAKDLFHFADWQNPDVQDLMDCTDDEEARELYGQTWEEMFGSRKVRQIQIDPLIARWINKILHAGTRNKDGCPCGACIYTRIAVFDNHVNMAVSVKYYDDEAYSRPWTEAVLFYDGGEVTCSEARGEFFGTWALTYKGNTYTVIVEEAEK